MESKSFLLIPAVQTYAWGKPGSSSAVAQLSANSIPGFSVSDDVTYAELWMGTHPKGPSKVAETGSTLSDWLEKNPSCVGEKVQQTFNTPGQLPFLFKVLSVNISLSIQAHPNKKLAEILHSEKPDKYPDPNHKPEMAVALTPFEGLCGFRPKQEICKYLKAIPELRTIIGDAIASEFENSTNKQEEESSLQNCFTALMTCDAETLTTQLNLLLSRAEKMDKTSKESEQIQVELLLRLNSQFPGDVGCFIIYFLNPVFLQPGEAMFLEANLPHAYLSGNIIECMACSDNVVRAGLTPKFKDVATLCQMLNYEGKPAEECKFSAETTDTDPYIQVFNPPVPDFTVARIQLPAELKEYQIQVLDSASIVLVIEGSASVSSASSSPSGEHSLQLQKGSVLFVSANESLSVNVKKSNMLLFRAYCQL